MKKAVDTSKMFETCNSTYRICSENILHIRKLDTPHNKEKIEQNALDLQEFLSHRKYLTILNNTGMPYCGKEVRLIMARELPKICTALAIVSDDQESADLATLFVAICPLPIPVKTFRNNDEAKQWLTSLMQFN